MLRRRTFQIQQNTIDIIPLEEEETQTPRWELSARLREFKEISIAGMVKAKDYVLRDEICKEVEGQIK